MTCAGCGSPDAWGLWCKSCRPRPVRRKARQASPQPRQRVRAAIDALLADPARLRTEAGRALARHLLERQGENRAKE
jgi:hypothetical protein